MAGRPRKSAAPARRNLTRRSTVKAIPKAEAMRKVIDLIASGHKAGEAMHAVGRTYDTYKLWYRDEESFRSQVKYLRALAERAANDKTGAGPEPVPDFPDFCRDFLKQPLYE